MQIVEHADRFLGGERSLVKDRGGFAGMSDAIGVRRQDDGCVLSV